MERFSNYLKEIRSKGKRSFTLDQAMKDLGLKRGNILTSVYRAKKRSEIISPASGLYVIVPPEHQAYGCIPAEELTPILMDYMQADYYVALLSAAAYYGASHQKSASFQNTELTRWANFVVAYETQSRRPGSCIAQFCPTALRCLSENNAREMTGTKGHKDQRPRDNDAKDENDANDKRTKTFVPLSFTSFASLSFGRWSLCPFTHLIRAFGPGFRKPQQILYSVF